MNDFKIGLKVFIVLTFFTGVLYPGLISAYSYLVVKDKAHGSLIVKDGKLVGSDLLGQKFSRPEYFWGRPSAIDYNPTSSGASNQGPTSEALKKQVDERVITLKNANPDAAQPVSQDLIFASGSGLDPHISIEAAGYQAKRVAKARNLDLTVVMEAIGRVKEGRQFGILGEPRVNVLRLNLALDDLK